MFGCFFFTNWQFIISQLVVEFKKRTVSLHKSSFFVLMLTCSKKVNIKVTLLPVDFKSVTTVSFGTL